MKTPEETAARAKRERRREARKNRQEFGNWQDVLNAGGWFLCTVCNHRQFIRGDLRGRQCRNCRAPLDQVAM